MKPNNKNRPMKLLKKLNAEGRTIVLVTHDDEIAAYAQRSLIIRDGVIAADQFGQEQTTAAV